MHISVVLPCRNEEDAIGFCIKEIHDVLLGQRYEIIVADSSRDSSKEIACSLGAKVVSCEKGYGNAYRAGLREVRGDYIVMADADASYDFGEIPRFLEKLEGGFDFVMGSRFKGSMEAGSMHWSHRFGNSFLNGFFNFLFSTKFSDTHCGFRALTKDALVKLELQEPGMEFALEMIIRARNVGLSVAEVPIRYRRRIGASKLRPITDGMRHVFMMMKSIMR